MVELTRKEYSAPRVTGDPGEVSDGVFVIPDRRVSLVPNVGIVVGDDAALVIDTGVGPRNGRYVLEQATRLAGKRTLYLAITQLDPGHGFGIQAFKGTATIIFGAAQRDRLERYAPRYAEAFGKLGLGEAVEREFEGLELVGPDIVHDGHLTLDLGGIKAVLKEWGPAHTTDDQTVLVGDRVLFGGDLFGTRMFPILPYVPPFDVDFVPGRWFDALDNLIALEPEKVVPGHGEVADAGLIREVRTCLAFVRDEAGRLKADGVPFDEAAAIVEKRAIARWHTWEGPQMVRLLTKAFYAQRGEGA
ncbi:MBL fold metallo-hydrolase [Amycolatopsis pithecellobii]|uniref:MBL fold metallo-hydrolase n=1 Tax=Amycolatopsis pithecellobii TaxID=664692 RepID=A0A6N7Z1W8_9PSEU|nr:MBL fold metallo-hydrolase [Amycolatopsis pithecellobii]MTD52536.1 MBL fold metallo-hydrolase [Amycolatopsis pithecellobii]